VKKAPWTEREEDYLKQRYEFGDLKKIAAELGRTKKAISERAKVLKLRRDKETTRKQIQRYKVNEHFFSVWSHNMAYVLGLFCADGNMSKSDSRISICLHKDDKYLIKEILSCMDSTHKIIISRNTSNLRICNVHLYGDLLKLELTPNKSKTLKCPDIPKAFVADFIRGTMDGDGSVDTKNKRMKIVSASIDFINGLSGMFEELGVQHNVYNEPYVHNGVKTGFYILRVLRRKDVKKLYHLMYDDPCICMKRKKESFQKMGVEDKDFAVKCKSSMRPIIGTNTETNETIRFNSIKGAIRSGICNSRVHKVLRGDVSQHKNYTWKYA